MNDPTSEKIELSIFLKIFFTIFICLGITLLVFLCLNSYNYADDYGHMVIISQKSFSLFFDNLYFYYQNHLGRAFSFNVILTWFLVGFFPVQLLTLFWFFIHNIKCFLIYLIVFGIKLLKFNDLIIIGLIVLFSWVGMKTHIGYNVFWATGGYMALSGLFALFAVYLVLVKLKTLTFKGHIGRVLLFLNLGMLPENMAFAFGSWFVFYFLLEYYRNRQINLYYILYFCFFLFGFCVVFFSPGTQQRMEEENTLFSLNFIFNNYFYLISFYLFRNKVLIFFMISLGTFVYFHFNKYSCYFINKERLLHLIILCLLVTLPFSVMPSMSFVKRAGYFFSFFIAGSGLCLGLILGDFISKRLDFSKLKLFTTVIIMVSMSFVFINFYIQIPLFLDVKKQMDLREQILIDGKNQNNFEIELPMIDIDERLFTGRVLELSSNPDFLENARIAEYFGLSKVWIKSK
jgi:hypothetical protein